MALLKNLDPSAQAGINTELTRNESFIRGLYLDAVRRAVGFILTLLLGSALFIMATAVAHPITRLRLISLSCFLFGTLVVGVYRATEFHAVRKLLFGYSWFKYNVLTSQTDVDALVAPPSRLRYEWVSIALPYLAWAFWLAGISLLMIDLAAPRPVGTAIELVNKEPTPAQDTSVAPPISAVIPAPPTRVATPHEIQAAGRWSVADRIGLWALIASVIQAIALIVTFWIARTTGRRQLRAFVGPVAFDLLEGSILQPPDPTRSNVPGALVRIKNSGSTTAYKVRIASRIDVIEPMHENTITLAPLIDAFHSVLGPNVESTSTAWFNRPLTPNEITDIRNSARAIYLSGRIEYRDAFKRSRFTTFRLRYAGPFPPPAPATMAFATQGNDAD